MSSSLLAPHESLRLCFRSEIPVHWTLGEDVPLSISLENEAGVRVRHPHSHHVWTEPESASAREGMATGVPLRVALEGERSDRFLLDVTSLIGQGGEHGVNGGGVGSTSKGLTLDLSTGTANGSVAILLAARSAPNNTSDLAREAEAGEEDGCESAGPQEGGRGEVGGEVYLSISLCQSWADRLNRPVLPLESLPAPILSRPAPATGCVAGDSEGEAPSEASARPAGHNAVVRRGACSVRRLRFEVRDAQEGSDVGVERRREREEGQKAGEVGVLAAATTAATAAAVGAVPAPRRTPPSPPPTTASSSLPWSSSPSSLAATTAVAVAEQDGGDSVSERYSSHGGSRDTTVCKTQDNAAVPDVIEIRAAESIPLGGFFGTVWDCSLEIGAFLADLGPKALRGKRVVELGAGCGAVSTLCAALGASEVVATDEEDLLPLLTFNLERNKCPGFANVKACEYSWGSPIQDYPLLAGGDFDVVICSDLLYDPTGWEPLLASLRQLTARGGGGLGRRGGREARPSLPPPAAAASTAPPAAVAYLAHRTRNAQEREFFSLLLPGGEGGAGGGGKAGLGSGAAGGGHENGGKGARIQESSFTCRKLEGGVPQREAWVEGEGAGLREICSAVRGRAQGGEGRPEPVWRRGCFPDVALYELSPI